MWWGGGRLMSGGWLFAGGGADDGRWASELDHQRHSSLTTPTTRGPVDGTTRLPVNVGLKKNVSEVDSIYS